MHRSLRPSFTGSLSQKDHKENHGGQNASRRLSSERGKNGAGEDKQHAQKEHDALLLCFPGNRQRHHPDCARHEQTQKELPQQIPVR